MNFGFFFILNHLINQQLISNDSMCSSNAFKFKFKISWIVVISFFNFKKKFHLDDVGNNMPLLTLNFS